MSETQQIVEINHSRFMKRKFHQIEIPQRRMLLEIIGADINEKAFKKAFNKIKRGQKNEQN